MFKPFVLAAGAVLLCAAPALAGPAGDTLKDALYNGTLADGLGKLQPMAAAGDTEAAFGVGAIKLTQTLEQFAGGELKPVFRNGELLVTTTLAEIRGRLKASWNCSEAMAEIA